MPLLQKLLIFLFCWPGLANAGDLLFRDWHLYSDPLDVGTRVDVSSVLGDSGGVYIRFSVPDVRVGSGDAVQYPYAGIGFTLNRKEWFTPGAGQGISLTASIVGAVDLVLVQESIAPQNLYRHQLPESKDVRTIAVSWSQFSQPQWADTAYQVNQHPVTGVRLEAARGMPSSMWIADVRYVSVPPVADKPTPWALDRSFPEAAKRHAHGYVSYGQRHYLVGGRSADGMPQPTYSYDPLRCHWQRRSPPPLALHHIDPVVVGGKLFIASGYTGPCCDETALDRLYVYDPVADAWEAGTQIPDIFRSGAAGVVARRGVVYVFGGVVGGHHLPATRALRTVRAYNTETGAWTQLPFMPRPRDHFTPILAGSKVYLIGGRDTSKKDNSIAHAEIDVFDLESHSWQTLAPTANMRSPRSGAAYALAAGKIVVIGGESKDTVHSEVDVFDIHERSWAQGPALNIPRHGMQALYERGIIFVASGANSLSAEEAASLETLQFGEGISADCDH